MLGSAQERHLLFEFGAGAFVSPGACLFPESVFMSGLSGKSEKHESIIDLGLTSAFLA